MNTRGSNCTDSPSLCLAISIVHLAAKYVYHTLSLKTIISKALGAKANLVCPKEIIGIEDNILEALNYSIESLNVFDFIGLYASVA